MSVEQPLDAPLEGLSPVSNAIIARGDTGSLAVWFDYRNGAPDPVGCCRDVFGARLAKDGTVLDPHGLQLWSQTSSPPNAITFDGTSFYVFLLDGKVVRVRESDGKVDSLDVGSLSAPWASPTVLAFRAASTAAATLIVTPTLNVYVFLATDATDLDPFQLGAFGSSGTFSRVLGVGTDGTGFLVVFEVDGNSSSCHGVYAARFDVTHGAVDGAPPAGTCGSPRLGTLLFDDGPNGHPAAAAVGFDGTNYLVAVSDESPNMRGARIRASDGFLLDSPAGAGLLTIVAGNQDPQVAFDGTDFVVSSLSGSATVNPGDGSVQPMVVLSTVLNPPPGGSGSPNEIEHATPFEGSTRVAVSSTDGAQVLVGRQDLAGHMLDDPAILVSRSANSELSPVVSSDGTNFFTAWLDTRLPQDGFFANKGWATRLDPQGAALDPQGIAFSSRLDPDAQAHGLRVSSNQVSSLISWYSIQQGLTRVQTADGAVSDDVANPQNVIAATDGLAGLVSNGTDFLAAGIAPGNIPWGVRIDGVTGVPLDAAKLTLSPSGGDFMALAYGAGAYLTVWFDTDLLGVDARRIRSADGALLDPNPIAVIPGSFSSLQNPRGQLAVAFDGTAFLIVTFRDKATFQVGESPIELVGVRVRGADGVVLDPQPIVLPTRVTGDTRLVFDGVNFVLSGWRDDNDVEMIRIRPNDLAVLDGPGTFSLGLQGVFPGSRTATPELASDGGGTSLIAYSRYFPGPQLGSNRVVLRFLRETDPVVRFTSLAYSGATNGRPGQPANLSATLASSAGPLAGQALTFTLGTQTCTATTDATGAAACSLTAGSQVGPHPITVAFAGTPAFAASSATASFEVISPKATVLTYTGSAVTARLGTAHMAAVLARAGAIPVVGRVVRFGLGTGTRVQACQGTTDRFGRAQCEIANVDQPYGPTPIAVTFAGDVSFQSSSVAASTVVFGVLAEGAFVIGRHHAHPGQIATLWGADWEAENLPGAPRSFKGFAAHVAPACHGFWSADPNSSLRRPLTVPPYMAVIVTTSVTGSSRRISGDVTDIVIVKVDGASSGPSSPSLKGVVVASSCSAQTGQPENHE